VDRYASLYVLPLQSVVGQLAGYEGLFGGVEVNGHAVTHFSLFLNNCGFMGFSSQTLRIEAVFIHAHQWDASAKPVITDLSIAVCLNQYVGRLQVSVHDISFMDEA